MKNDSTLMLEQAIHAAKEAGSVIMTYFGYDDDNALTLKPDRTPQTRADTEASNFIEHYLHNKTDITVLSEENDHPDFEQRQKLDKYWLVDPLDGTKEFLSHNQEFVVSIALIQNNYPAIGVIYHPPSGDLYYAVQGQGTFKTNDATTSKKLTTRHWDNSDTVVYCSARHKLNDKVNKRLPEPFRTKPVGSALKFCYLAEGLGDIYPGFGKTCEWDIAAGHCILEQAGGVLKTADGDTYGYNLRQSFMTRPFWAVGDSRLLDYIMSE